MASTEAGEQDVASSVPSPYVGPRSLDRDHTIFGRDRERSELVKRLIGSRILVLHSQSGAGKTSLIESAVIPDLESEGFHVLPVVRSLRGSGDSPAGVNRYTHSTLVSLESGFRNGDTLDDVAGLSLDAYMRHRAPLRRCPRYKVLVFDQFEELLTTPGTFTERYEFFEQLGRALVDRDLWALFSMREEHLGGLFDFRYLVPSGLEVKYRLGLLGHDAARDAVREPARQAGVEFTDSALEHLLDDLEASGVDERPPSAEMVGDRYVEPLHLQVVCKRIWEGKRTTAGRIVSEDIPQRGGVNSALRRYYEATVESVSRGDSLAERSIREWFDEQLITHAQERAPPIPRTPALVERLGEGNLEALVDAHLLRDESRRQQTWLELAHDRLVGPVRTANAAWYESTLQPFQLGAKTWVRSGHAQHRLLDTDELTLATAYAEALPERVTAEDREFIAASKKRRSEVRTSERLRGAYRLIALLVAVLVVVGVGGYSFYEQNVELRGLARQSHLREELYDQVAERYYEARRSTFQSSRDMENRLRVTQEELSVTDQVLNEHLAVIAGLHADLAERDDIIAAVTRERAALETRLIECRGY